jgi:hypothetical protein
LLLTALTTTAHGQEPAARDALWKKLEPYAQPPEEFAGKPRPTNEELRATADAFAVALVVRERLRQEVLEHECLSPSPTTSGP